MPVDVKFNGSIWEDWSSSRKEHVKLDNGWFIDDVPMKHGDFPVSKLSVDVSLLEGNHDNLRFL